MPQTFHRIRTYNSLYNQSWLIVNRSVAQIPQCTSPISHNAPFCNRTVHMCAHFCYKIVHYGMFAYCIMGFVRWVYCGEIPWSQQQWWIEQPTDRSLEGAPVDAMHLCLEWVSTIVSGSQRPCLTNCGPVTLYIYIYIYIWVSIGLGNGLLPDRPSYYLN